MRRARSSSPALFALAVAACFDGAELTRDLPCTKHTHCGGQDLCINGTCQNPDTAGGDDDGGDDGSGGDPCATGGNVCLDANTLGVCDLDTQMTMPISCDERCGTLDAIGCRSAMGPQHDCYCDQATAACNDTDVPTCNGTVRVACSGGQLDLTDCDEVCQETGQVGSCNQYGGASGNEAVCECSTGSCYDGASFCQDDDTAARCMSGVWQLTPCTDAACQELQCPESYNTCPENYQAQTLGCGYTNSDLGCLCTI
jgi:hypothetical protein